MKKSIRWLLACLVFGLITLTGCDTATPTKALQTQSDGEESEAQIKGEKKPESSETIDGTKTSEEPKEKGTVEVVELPQNPKKIVTFDYAVADLVSSLELEEEIELLMPSETLPKYLEVYATVPDVGSAQEPNFEVIKEFQPEIIFVTPQMQERTEELKKIAPVFVLPIDYGNYLESAYSNARTIGQMLDVPDQVEEKIYECSQIVEEVEGQLSSQSEITMVLLTEGDKIRVFGEKSKMGWLGAELGLNFVDTAIADDPDGVNVDTNYILGKDPERIFYIDMSEVEGESNRGEPIFIEELSETKAAVAEKIHRLTTSSYQVPGGLTAIATTGEEIRKIVSE